MSRNKPLSKEEKRLRLKALFTETKDVYLLKELEKIAPKEKGIVAKTVEEVLKEIVDDNLVHSEKIGTSIYFWQFPSEDVVKQECEIADLQKELDAKTQKVDELTAENERLKRDRSGDDEREQKVEELNYFLNRKEELKKQLEIYKENDPEMLAEMKEQIGKAKSAVNRWTDSIFMIQSYAKGKINVPTEELNKGLGIPNDLDYIE